MRVGWLSGAFFVVCTLLLFGPSMKLAKASEPPALEQVGGADAITTTLHPGWNMVGWLGPDTPASEIFDAVPELGEVVAWDAVTQRYMRMSRSGDGELLTLTPGMGFWLHVEGDERVPWTRASVSDGLVLDLYEGSNIIGWTGGDGVPVRGLLSQLGDTLESAWQWDSEAQRFNYYFPDPATGNTITELRHGDALWLVLASDARLWAAGTTRPTFTFHEEMTAEERGALRTSVESVREVFARHFGVHTANFDVRVGGSRCGTATASVLSLSLECSDGSSVVAHEYFHVLQQQLASPSGIAPVWLTEGAAIYAEGVYDAVTSETQTVEGWLATEHRVNVACAMSAPNGAYPLASIDYDVLSRDIAAACLVALAADLLVDLSGHGSLISYYDELSLSGNVQSSFAEAFGLDVDVFYETFLEHLRGLPPPYPHLADNEVEPVLVLLGDIPPETERAMRRELEMLQAFFNVRFEAGSADYTIYVGINVEALQATFLDLTGSPLPKGTAQGGFGALQFVVLDQLQLPYTLYHQHFSRLLERLAPWQALPPVLNRHGPDWLTAGTRLYIRSAYQEEQGIDSMDRVRDEQMDLAVQSTRPLTGMETGVGAYSYQEVSAVGFLAADWLAGHAGEAALLNYYRQLPSSQSWQHAFEAAFRLSVEDFYEAFESYRATLTER